MLIPKMELKDGPTTSEANATVHAENAKTPRTAEPVITEKELGTQENKITNIYEVSLHDPGPLWDPSNSPVARVWSLFRPTQA